MVLLGDKAQVILVLVCFEIVLILMQDMCMVLCRTYHRLENRFGRTGWYSKVMRLKWMLVLVYSETVVVLVQDNCTVCAKRTIGKETILDAPNGTPR
jgi:hypothetical protein